MRATAGRLIRGAWLASTLLVAARASSFDRIRFSPDGRYVLAERDSEITILTVDPFAVDFYIRRQYSSFASFTPDSREVVFINQNREVERWRLGDRNRAASAALPVFDCGTERLSPDGRSWACLDHRGTLHLIDVESGKAILTKRRFGKRDIAGDIDFGASMYYIGDPGDGQIDFSSDGRYVLMASNASPTVAWDLKEGRRVTLRGALWSLRLYYSDKEFAFLGANQVVRQKELSGKYRRRGITGARIIAFPSGRLVGTAKIPYGPFSGTSDPGFGLVRHPLSHLNALIQLATEKLIVSETPALDALGNHYAAQLSEGEIGLYEIGKGLQASAVVQEK